MSKKKKKKYFLEDHRVRKIAAVKKKYTDITTHTIYILEFYRKTAKREERG